MANKNLSAAKRSKNDEFYTRLDDISNECKNYKEHFKGKVILCNCDDPYESAFFKYFALNLLTFGLKGLMATCYNGSTISDHQLSLFPDEEEKTTRVAHSIVLLPEHFAEYNRVDEDILKEVIEKKYLIKKLKGNGDFASEECVEFLKQADVVVTNPPFSKFREFVATLMEYDKKFLIIGNKNAITYKEFFPLLKENKVWIGFTNVKEFIQPDRIIKKFGNIGWFTNLDISKRHEKLILWKNYTPEEYPKYDNYDAINVDKVAEIPCDYCESWGVTKEEFAKLDEEQWEMVRREHDLLYIIPSKENPLRKLLYNHEEGYKEKIEAELYNAVYCNGVMGVPITFMDKYNPEDFEIIGADEAEGTGFSNGLFVKNSLYKQCFTNGQRIYKRIFIQR